MGLDNAFVYCLIDFLAKFKFNNKGFCLILYSLLSRCLALLSDYWVESLGELVGHLRVLD